MQKTAYELCISDLSSEVCSSQQPCAPISGQSPRGNRSSASILAASGAMRSVANRRVVSRIMSAVSPSAKSRLGNDMALVSRVSLDPHMLPLVTVRQKLKDLATGHRWRSEEHTSELQSLMRISYAVFCLKKKNINQ